MRHYCKTSHSVCDIKNHIVWITKYRKPVLVGELARRVRELLRQIFKSHVVEVFKGYVSRSRIHPLVSVPPHLSVSHLVKELKVKSSWKVMCEFKSLSKQYWGSHFFGRGYFAASSVNVTDEVIMEYVKNQEVELDDEFQKNDF